MPQQICKACKRELDISVKFKEKCANSNKVLKHFDYNCINIKDNPNAKKKMIACKDCQIKFYSEASLNMHIERKHKFLCQICNQRFVNRKMLLEHLKFGHKIERPQIVRTQPGYKCHVCNDILNSNKELLFHVKIHYNPKHLRCDMCSTTFLTYDGFIKHMERYSRLQMFSCKICAEVFHHSSSFQSHMESHNSKDKFVCSICNETFQSKRNLSYHLRNHKKKNEFAPAASPSDTDEIMEDTEKVNGFPENGDLSETLMQCELCEKMCWGLEELKQHVLMHMGDEEEKPYVCKLCGDSFKRSNTLKSHFKSHYVEVSLKRP